jgi:electron transfer flavoprotein alpha subunit
MTDSTNNVLIVAEASGTDLRPVSFELVTAGKQVAAGTGGAVTALLMGSGIDAAAATLCATGVDRVLVADDTQLAHLTSESATAVLVTAINQVSPGIVLIPGTTSGRDYAPRAAARLGVGLAADCVELSVEDGSLVAVRPVLGGKVQTAVRMPGSHPQMATVRPGSFEKAATDGAGAPTEQLSVTLSPDDLRVTVTGTADAEAGTASLDSAQTIVAGGRGLKEPDKFSLIDELAGALNAAVGASRAVVDAGWRPHHEQVGQTGRTVSPKLYIAVGISGAVQHLVGMQGSETIVAINRDPDAPIFKIASFGIVGDLFEVVPALVAELRAARS